MKKLCLLGMALFAGAGAFGQGYVSFANTSTSKVSTNYPLGGPGNHPIAGAPGSYYFALFVAPTTVTTSLLGMYGVDPTSFGWVFTGNLATNGTLPGRFSGNADANGGVPINVGPVHSPGDVANYMVTGWAASLGTTWSAFQTKLDSHQLNDWSGNSGIALNVIAASSNGAPSAIPPIAGDPAAGRIGPFMLAIIPEPSTMALWALGTAALALRKVRRLT